MLIYTGGGSGGSLPGLPARDLQDEEVERLGGEKKLLATGLYEKPLQPETKRKYSEKVVENDGTE